MADITTDLAHYWSVEDRTDYTLEDLAGDLDITASNATFVEGLYDSAGEAVQLPADSGYLDLGADVDCGTFAVVFALTDLDLDANFTENAASDQSLWLIGNDTATDYGEYYPGLVANELSFWDGNECLSAEPAVLLDDTAPHVLAFVPDGTDCLVYKDGVYAGTFAGVGSLAVRYIGNPSDYSSWAGTIVSDEIRVYSRGLTAKDNEGLYEHIAGLIACWKLTGLHAISLPRRTLTGSHAVQGIVTAALSGLHALRTEARRILAGLHALTAAGETDTRVSLTGLHAMYDTRVILAPRIYYWLDGVAIEAASVEISQEIDGIYAQCDLRLLHKSAYNRADLGAELIVQITPLDSDTGAEGEALEWVFLVDSKSYSGKSGKNQWTVTALSPAKLLLGEQSGITVSKTWTRALASEIAAEVAGLGGMAISWEITDQRLDSFSVEDQNPLDVLATLATDGGTLFSRPDGSLCARWLHPNSPADWDSVTAELELTDAEDVIESERTPEAGGNYNRVSITEESEDAGGPSITLQEWSGTDLQAPDTLPDTQKWIAAFISPDQDVALVSEGCETDLFYQGQISWEHEEYVTITDGVGELAYAPSQVLEYSYLCRNLGAFELDGKDISCAVADNGLLYIRYKFLVRLWIAESSSQTWQLISCTIDDDAAVDSDDLYTVIRGDGLREAPEILVDALCQTDAVKRKRCIVYLDEALDAETIEYKCAPRALAAEPGDLAEITQKETGLRIRAELTAVRYVRNESEHRIYLTFWRAV